MSNIQLTARQKIITLAGLFFLVVAAANWYFQWHNLGGYASQVTGLILIWLVVWLERFLWRDRRD